MILGQIKRSATASNRACSECSGCDGTALMDERSFIASRDCKNHPPLGAMVDDRSFAAHRDCKKQYYVTSFKENR
jgi:hypothetical protein